MYGFCEMCIEQINNTAGTVEYPHHDQAGSMATTRNTKQTRGSSTYEGVTAWGDTLSLSATSWVRKELAINLR
jgi:hypothetical protein